MDIIYTKSEVEDTRYTAELRKQGIKHDNFHWSFDIVS